MARPRGFDRDDVLLRATRLFWRKGYEATTLSEVLAATGLSKSSLYNTFGDKRRLFLEAMGAYRRDRMARLRQALDDGRPGRESIAAFFQEMAERREDSERRLGCMSCNEAVELGPTDAEVQRLVNADFRDLEDAFVAAIARGQADGSITRREDPRRLGRFLTSSLQGLHVLSRAGADAATLEDAVAMTLSTLNAAAPGAPSRTVEEPGPPALPQAGAR